MKPYKKYFYKHIRNEFPLLYDSVFQETNLHFQSIFPDIQFMKTSGNPMDKRLEFCAYFLALIKTLDSRKIPFEKIRQLCLVITVDYVQPVNKIQAFIKKLIPKLTHTFFGKFLIKMFAEKVGKNNSKDGFIAKIITDKQDTYGLGYGIDVLECGICKLFHKHNYSKFAPILCEVDEITSGLAGLELIRSGTIANGAKKCDFRFKPKK